ncbi:MAG: family oxidoreductase [Segetibacter sp.]|nr:family oxidoreductase [Segetibacter sp.]
MQKKNVVITGATKGIGRAIAEKFAAEGYHILACARTEKDLLEVQSDFAIRFPGVSVKVRVTDVSDIRQVQDFAKWVTASGVTTDILVNNAGYFIPGKIISEEEGMLQKMMEVNLFSCYHLIRDLLPAMIERKQGHIFNICSIASFKPLPDVGSYGISKFALLGLTRHLREELKPHGIKVTAVSPGATWTSSWEGADVDPKRLMDVNDVAKMVFASSQLSPSSVVEDIVMRPQSGDL